MGRLPRVEKLREWRVLNGLTLDQVGQYCGVTRQAVWHYEKGRSEPSPKVVLAMSKLYGVSPRSILENVTKENRNKKAIKE